MAEVVTVVSGDPSITYNADGSKNYIFSGGSGSGYVKSTCSTSGIPDCGSGSARFVITPNGANSILVVAYQGASGQATTQYWSGYASSATIDYRVSTAPSGSGGGTIKIKPSVPEKTTTQKFGYYVHVPASAEEQTKVFLVQQGSTAAQNFAFDFEDEYDAIE